MVNRKVTAPGDPLIRMEVLIPQSMKDYLSSLDRSASQTIRELIDLHRQRFMANADKLFLIQSIKDGEIKLAMDKANLKQIEENERLEASRRTDFENKKKAGLEVLVRKYREYSGDFSKFKPVMCHWGDDVLKISQDELKGMIIEEAKTKAEAN